MFEEDDDAQDPAYDLLLAVALLDLGNDSVKNEEFWNSEVERAAMQRQLENMSPNQEIRGRRRRRRKTVEKLPYSSNVKLLKKIGRFRKGGSWRSRMMTKLFCFVYLIFVVLSICNLEQFFR
jgi:hypothetical protein